MDYLHPRKFPVLGRALTWVLRATTVGVLVGVYQFNTNDIGTPPSSPHARIWPALSVFAPLGWKGQGLTRSNNAHIYRSYRTNRQGMACLNSTRRDEGHCATGPPDATHRVPGVVRMAAIYGSFLPVFPLSNSSYMNAHSHHPRYLLVIKRGGAPCAARAHEPSPRDSFEPNIPTRS